MVVDAIENRRKELIDIDLSNFAKQAESLAKLHGVESVEALLELTKTRKNAVAAPRLKTRLSMPIQVIRPILIQVLVAKKVRD